MRAVACNGIFYFAKQSPPCRVGSRCVTSSSTVASANAMGAVSAVGSSVAGRWASDAVCVMVCVNKFTTVVRSREQAKEFQSAKKTNREHEVIEGGKTFC